MADKKLESFKIGDTQPRTAAPIKGSGKPQEEAISLGFSRIENMLEREDPVNVGEDLNKILKDLEEYQEKAPSNKEKLAAKKAIAAVERAADLMDFLFQTKEQMAAN